MQSVQTDIAGLGETRRISIRFTEQIAAIQGSSWKSCKRNRLGCSRPPAPQLGLDRVAHAG